MVPTQSHHHHRPRHSALKRSYSAPAAKPLAAYPPGSLSNLPSARGLIGSQTSLVHTPSSEHPLNDPFALGGFFPSHSAGVTAGMEHGWDWLRAESSTPPLPALSLATTITSTTSTSSSNLNSNSADEGPMNTSRSTRRVRFEMDLHRPPSPLLQPPSAASHATSPSSSLPTTPELVYAPLGGDDALFNADDVVKAEDKLGLVSLSENLPKLFTSTLLSLPRSSPPTLLSPHERIDDDPTDTDALHTAFCARRRAHSMPPTPAQHTFTHIVKASRLVGEETPMSPGGLFLPPPEEPPQEGWTGYLVEQVKRWLI